MMTANKVFAEFCSCLDKAKDDMGISSSWQVLARNAQDMVNVDRTILVDKIQEIQKGFQNSRIERDAFGIAHEYWEWIEEYVFQVSCVRERRIDDTVYTDTSDEVASLLKAWMDSFDGIEFMRSKGLAPLAVKAIVPQQYTSENDVYQRYVHFDVGIQVVQVIERTPSFVGAIDLGIVHYPLCDQESGGPTWERIWEDTASA